MKGGGPKSELIFPIILHLNSCSRGGGGGLSNSKLSSVPPPTTLLNGTALSVMLFQFQALSSGDLLGTHITGIINHSAQKLLTFLDINEYCHDSNLVVNLLLVAIKEYCVSQVGHLLTNFTLRVNPIIVISSKHNHIKDKFSCIIQ